MTTKEAIEYYGGRKALADALGVWPQVIYTWGEYPPMARQYELEVKTDGALKARREVSHG
jgi:transcriptional repressor of cell division inhibition gene dicB